MKKSIYILLLFISTALFATHNRAGEITYRYLGGFKYEITITTYTKIGGGVVADRDDLEIMWGDGSSAILPRISFVDYGVEESQRYRHNIYRGTHTFPGIGVYELVMQDPNRNSGIQNIPESVNIVFAIKTQLKISAILGNNNTPILLNKPLDKGAVGQVFIHNPGAYDPDGDSLAYKLTTCLGYNGVPINNYSLPQASHSISINEYTGDFIWDSPMKIGEYNVAILIEEWRNGVFIGQTLRDMQIDIKETQNIPPKIEDLKDTCIVAGENLQFDVIANDDNDYSINLTAAGVNKEEISEIGNPSFGNAQVSPGHITKTFRWTPSCDNVKNQPYTIVFKAEDNNNDVSLVDIKSIKVKVIAPAPSIDTLMPTNNSVKIKWHASICNDVKGYYIYRKNEYFGYTPSYCETGVPEYTGYIRIAKINSKYADTYIDNNNGLGLVQGYNYCYMIVAYYDDGAESYASEEKCTELVQGIPIITNVSVEQTAIDTGKIYLAWSAPKDFDTINAPGPYKYLIYRSADMWGENFILIDSLQGINDTIYIDENLNTKENIYTYKVEFYNDEPNNRFLIGAPHMASSVFIKLFGEDNKIKIKFDKNVPWHNNKYTIYRKVNNIFDSLTTITTDTFVDINLANEIERCYYVKAIGRYPKADVINPIINFSQISCTEPIDTFPPCKPHYNVTSVCDSMYNYIKWNNPNNLCTDDVIKYNIYYSQTTNGKMVLIHTINNANDTTYKHYPSVSIAGCYYVTAIDSFNNESNFGTRVCIDNCEYYKLPNIFTPNGDGKNDLFRPASYKFVDKVDMKIYNRWGNLIFQTDDPDILWDGTVNGKNVPGGVYYYVCDVYEYRLSGILPRNISGFVHVERGKETQNNE